MHETFQNKDEFQKLYKSYFTGLVNFVYARYIHDKDEARDVVQNTFLKIWKNRDKIKINTSIKSYLFQAVKNTSFDYIRKNSRIEVLDEEGLRKYEKYELESEEIDEMNSYQIRVYIKEALEEIKPKMKKIFELNKFEGLTYQEIADHLNISKRSVEDNMFRTMSHLKISLKNKLNSEF